MTVIGNNNEEVNRQVQIDVRARDDICAGVFNAKLQFISIRINLDEVIYFSQTKQ